MPTTRGIAKPSIFLNILLILGWPNVAKAQAVAPLLPAIPAQCGDEGLLTDDDALAVSLLQLGAKRLLNIEQSPKRVAATAVNTENTTAAAETSQLSHHVGEDKSPEQISTLASEAGGSHSGIHRVLQLFQDSVLQLHRCHNQPECDGEGRLILITTCSLLLLIMSIFTAFFFFREDKEEQVTPLCPQLVVREGSMNFKIALDRTTEKCEIVIAEDPSKCVAKLAMDWPDPFRPCASGIASTARLMNTAGMNMATVVARNCAVSGQALALCRHGCEIFGFIEPDTAMRYHVKHRTGVHLLTLVGDFATWKVDGVNPAGAVVFQTRMEDGCIIGKVHQNVDAGLMICCVVAATVHRILQQPASTDSINSLCDAPIADVQKVEDTSASVQTESPQKETDTPENEATICGKGDPESQVSGNAAPTLEQAPEPEIHEY
jgi:hypothetical protein